MQDVLRGRKIFSIFLIIKSKKNSLYLVNSSQCCLENILFNIIDISLFHCSLFHALNKMLPGTVSS